MLVKMRHTGDMMLVKMRHIGDNYDDGNESTFLEVLQCQSPLLYKDDGVVGTYSYIFNGQESKTSNGAEYSITKEDDLNNEAH